MVLQAIDSRPPPLNPSRDVHLPRADPPILGPCEWRALDGRESQVEPQRGKANWRDHLRPGTAACQIFRRADNDNTRRSSAAASALTTEARAERTMLWMIPPGRAWVFRQAELKRRPGGARGDEPRTGAARRRVAAQATHARAANTRRRTCCSSSVAWVRAGLRGRRKLRHRSSHIRRPLQFRRASSDAL